VIKNLRHIAIAVPDIEIALEFYLGLGLNLDSRDTEFGSFISQLTGIPNIVLHTAKLSLPDGNRVELIQNVDSIHSIDPTQKNPTSKGRTKDFLPRIHHLALSVSDALIFESLILELGGEVISKPIKVPLGHSLHAVPAVHFFAHDPFGNIIHVAQDAK
jgi:catechol 2,3-dioxygenase-like lactoylglutathione lyase family enzyme